MDEATASDMPVTEEATEEGAEVVTPEEAAADASEEAAPEETV